MKAIRAWHVSLNYYIKLFKKQAGMTSREFHERGFYPRSSDDLDATDRLTALRENLSAAGYGDAVEKTDARFLAEHRGYNSEADWEAFWTSFCARHNLNLRKDAL